MDFNLIGFVSVKLDAERRGLPPHESARSALVAAMMPSTLTAFAVGRALTTRKLEEGAHVSEPPAEKHAVSLATPQHPRGDGHAAPDGASSSGAAAGTVGGHTHGSLVEHCEDAAKAAEAAAEAANLSRAASEAVKSQSEAAVVRLDGLRQDVAAGFASLETKLSGGSPPTATKEKR